MLKLKIFWIAKKRHRLSEKIINAALLFVTANVNHGLVLMG